MTANFAAGPNTTTIAHLGIPFSLILDTQVLTGATGDKAVTRLSGYVGLTKSSAATDLTIALPDQDGQILFITDEGGHAHVITQATDGFNAKGSSGTLTWGGTLGSSVILVSRNGHWWVYAASGVTVA